MKKYSPAALALMGANVTLKAVADGASITRPAVSMQLSGENRITDLTLTAIRTLGGAELATEVATLAQAAFDERRAT